MTDHLYFDHPSVAGSPASDLRDALASRGWDVVLAHTGGGVMAVSVKTGDEEIPFALVGCEGPLDAATSGGLDAFGPDTLDDYLGSASVTCAPGEFVTAIENLIRAILTGDERLS